MYRHSASDRLRPLIAFLFAFATIAVVATPCFAEGKGKKIIRSSTVRIAAPAAPGAGAVPEPFSFSRKYVVYLPSNYNPAKKLPLVMVLHGCLEQGRSDIPFIETIEDDTKFDELADTEQFIVVYPNHRLDWLSGSVPFCWEWWMDANIHQGRGEVADLAGIVDEVKKEYAVDPNRIHVTGISSGGAMTVAALVAYSEIFASGSPTAGMPYGETEMDFMLHNYKPVDQIAAAMTAEMGANKRAVPILVIQSEADTAVNPRYAENIRDSWGMAFGINTQSPASSVDGATKGTSWTYKKFAVADGKTVVETLTLHRRPYGGLDHGWYGDGKAQYAFPDAPDTAKLVWEFFKAHPLVSAPAVGTRTLGTTPGGRNVSNSEGKTLK
jgi:poly(hydroxyalkanoate) depolymerase family esterase